MPLGGPPWEVTVGGTLGFDQLTTPAGTATPPGGSALYSALAAARRCPVHVVGVVGRDGLSLRDLLAARGADALGVEVREGRTYRWRAVHGSGDGPPLAERQRLGVYRTWRPDPPPQARRSRLLFLGSMPPRCQRQLLDAMSGPELVGLDTMRDYIERHRLQLAALLPRVDLLFLNRHELAALAGGESARLLGRGRLRALVLKDGSRGARLLTRGGSWTVSAAAAAVVDPTGAGDALAGGMVARLAQLRSTTDRALLDALGEGARAASRAISAFGPEGLLPRS